MPSACLAVVASLCDRHTVTAEVARDFPLRFPNVALLQNRFLRFVNLRKPGDPLGNQASGSAPVVLMKSCCDEQVAEGQLPPNIRPPLAGRSAKLFEKRRTTF